MATKRFKDGQWEFPASADGRITEWDHVQIAVLMDIRDELKKLNRTLDCPNFQALPQTISRIRSTVDGLRRDLKKLNHQRIKKGKYDQHH